MLRLVMYELALRRRVLFGLSALLFVYIGLVMWSWGGGAEERAKLYEELLRQFPEELIKIFAKGVPAKMSAEVFYALEYFVFMYLLVMAAYMSYLGAGTIADGVLERTDGINLMIPLSRRGVLLSRLLSLIILSFMITLVSIGFTILFSEVFGSRLDYGAVSVLHIYGLLCLSAWATLGALLASVLPVSIAKPAAAGVAIILYLVDTMTSGTDLEALGYFSPSRYVPVLEIALHGATPANDLIALLFVTTVGSVVASYIYERKDLMI